MARIQHRIAAELESMNQEKRDRKEQKKAKKLLKKESKNRRDDKDRDSYNRTVDKDRDSYNRRVGRDRDDYDDRRSHRDDRRREEENDRHRHSSGKRSRSSSSSSSSSNSSTSNHRHGKVQRSRHDDVTADKRYGLQGSEASSKNSKEQYFGPNPELLAKKAAEAKLLEDNKKKPRVDVKKLSEEERLHRIRMMEEDAKVNEDLRLHRLRNASSRAAVEDKKNGAPQQVGGQFVREIRSDVYGSSSQSTVADRIGRNIHYSQRGNDLESQAFMKR